MYMGLMRVLLNGLACTPRDLSSWFSSDDDTNSTSLNNDVIIALPETACFEAPHLAIVPCAMLGIALLFPSAMLIRPLCQTLDTKFGIHFNFSYLFVFGLQ